jgi:hypothetical protein
VLPVLEFAGEHDDAVAESYTTANNKTCSQRRSILVGYFAHSDHGVISNEV